MDIRTDSVDDVLEHYGIKRRSGRYPWGSGDRPYQNSSKHSGDYALNRTYQQAMANDIRKKYHKISSKFYFSRSFGRPCRV